MWVWGSQSGQHHRQEMDFATAKFQLQPFWQEEDRKAALKAFGEVFKTSTSSWTQPDLFLKQRQARSPLVDCPSTGIGFSSRTRRLEMAGWDSLGLGGIKLFRVHGHITKCTWRFPAPQMFLNRKMQSHSRFPMLGHASFLMPATPKLYVYRWGP